MIDIRVVPNADWKNLTGLGSRLLGIMMSGPDRLMLEIVQTVSRNFKFSIRDAGRISNSQATIILKGSSTPLVETGKLVNSIIWRKLSRHVYYAGIDPVAKTSRGVPYSVIATMQDTGYVIPVTDAIRAFMAENGVHVRHDTQFFVVPPRPFLSTALDKSMNEIQTILNKHAKIWVSRVRMY
jgi:hypothetical protein